MISSGLLSISEENAIQVHPDQLVALPMSIPSGDLSVAAENETTIEADTPTAGNSHGAEPQLYRYVLFRKRRNL